MAFWSWSRTAGSNGNSDSTINFLEGQAPSTLNDSNRAGMARLREYADDITGAIVTGGTSTAYTVTTFQVFDTLAHLDKQIVAFTAHTTCGATVTLNVDGLGAKPLRTSTGVELPAGLLVAGTPYVALYNNSDAVFYLRDFYALPYAVPIGMMAPYVVATVPNSNFALPCGQAISRTTYATLFALVGTTYGSGDGSTTFGVPDLRGRAVFGQDGIGGFGTTSRITVAGGNFNGTVLGGTGGNEAHTLTIAEIPAHNHGGGNHTHGYNQAAYAGAPATAGGSGAYYYVQTAAVTDASGVIITTQGSGNSHTILPPAIVLPYILRVI